VGVDNPGPRSGDPRRQHRPRLPFWHGEADGLRL